MIMMLILILSRLDYAGSVSRALSASSSLNCFCYSSFIPFLLPALTFSNVSSTLHDHHTVSDAITHIPKCFLSQSCRLSLDYHQMHSFVSFLNELTISISTSFSHTSTLPSGFTVSKNLNSSFSPEIMPCTSVVGVKINSLQLSNSLLSVKSCTIFGSCEPRIQRRSSLETNQNLGHLVFLSSRYFERFL